MEMWTTDIGNRSLEAKTPEKSYVIIGTEFGGMEGDIIMFS